MAKNLEIKKEVVFYAKLLDKKGLVNPLEGNISIYDSFQSIFRYESKALSITICVEKDE